MEWISVKDEPPPQGEVLFVYLENDEFDYLGPYFVAEYLGDGEWTACNDTYPNGSNYIGFSPTHWMFPPEPPT